MEQFHVQDFIREVESLPEDQQLEAVDALRGECDKTLCKIHSELDEARKHFRMTGQYTDPEWFCAAENARRKIAFKSHRLNEYRGKLKKRLNQSHSEKERDSFLERFWVACKQNLKPEHMAELVLIANQR